MTAWLLLAGAIVSEVASTLGLRVASVGGRRAWYAAVGAGYVVSFTLLGLALSQGLGLGVAYAVWAAAGIALTAVASAYLFREPLSPLMRLGLAVILAGVVLLEVGQT